MTPLVFEELTPEELHFLSDDTGCGNKEIDVPDWIFLPACKEHDMGYFVGGSKEDRAVVDKLFLENMVKAAGEQDSWWMRRWYTMLAYVYYYAVRVRSGSYFYYGEKRGKEDLAAAMEVKAQGE
jgi:hypothetical protein